MAGKDWSQVKEIFNAALRQNTDERPVFLDAVCDGDIDLRIEVESLLIAFDEGKSFLETPVVGETSKKSEWRLHDGQIISHFKVLSPIASGGMGEVYLAEDLKLSRRVALKVLPEHLNADIDRFRRFQREAQAVSTLNHPNILTIFEFDEQDSLHIIASEFVEGETLRHRLRRGNLTIAECIDIGIQVASALQAAHAAGVIHRDIKPENIMIREDGLVKVLDFGLAKLTERTENGDISDTLTEFFSHPGMIMGTAAYMSPEQARAVSIDARTDIFSLGVVLYEMLTGRPPFKGNSVADVIAGVIQTDPPRVSSLVPGVPDDLDSVIARTLEKNRANRYGSTGEMLADLRRLLQPSGSFPPELSINAQATQPYATPALTGSWRSGKRLLAFGTALTVVLVGAAAIWRINSQSSPTNTLASMRMRQLVSWDAEAGEGDPNAKFSPNGTMIALSLRKDGKRDIWTKQISGGKLNPVTDGKWDYYNPIWSPDGERIVFLSNREDRIAIWEAPFTGGEISIIKPLESDKIVLLRWSNDGTKIFYQKGVYQEGQNLFSLDLTSGQTTQLTEFDSAVKAQFIAVSPDENRVVYSSGPGERLNLFATTLGDDGVAEQITDDDSASNEFPAWLPDGKRIIYGCKRDGVYQPCLAHLEERRTEPINLGINDTLISDVAADGSKILLHQTREESDLWRIEIDRNGEARVTSEAGLELSPDVSPDGENVVFLSAAETKRVHWESLTVLSVADGQQLKIASSGFSPRFSPDGQKVAFLRDADNRINLWKVDRSGAEETRLMTDDVWFEGYSLLPYNHVQASDYAWSPDGNYLIYCAKKDGLFNVWRAAADGAGSPPQPVSNNSDPVAVLSSAAFDPDGKRIGYTATTNDAAAKGKKATRLHVVDGETTQEIFSTGSSFKFFGWANNGVDLLIAMPDDVPAAKPIKIKLILVSTSRKSRELAVIDDAYFYNIHLSPDGQRVAVATREEGKDRIEIVSLEDGGKSQLDAAFGPNEYISGITWSPDGKTIYFGKQRKGKIISMIENFK